MRLRRLWQASAKHSDPAAPTEPTKSKSDIPSRNAARLGRCGSCGAPPPSSTGFSTSTFVQNAEHMKPEPAG